MILYVDDNSGVLFLRDVTVVVDDGGGGGYTWREQIEQTDRLNRRKKEEIELLLIIKIFTQVCL